MPEATFNLQSKEKVGSWPHAASQLGSPWAFFLSLSLSHMLFILPQGVIDLEALGKKGYSVPKAGTIQVVSGSWAPVAAWGGDIP